MLKHTSKQKNSCICDLCLSQEIPRQSCLAIYVMIAQHFSRIIRQSTLNKCRIIHLKQVRQISISAISRQTMEDAKNKVSLLKEDPGNDAKLKMYALYKQV